VANSSAKVENATLDQEMKIRASVRIDINDVENFLKFHVSTNEIPVGYDRTGKDVVVDWYMLDEFDSNDKLWVDANGLHMVEKTLYKRKDYESKILTEGNKTVSSNYYPITSAIAIRDFSSGESDQKQILIMNDRPQGASAGLRNKRNIEIIHHRRYKKAEDSYDFTNDPLNDLEPSGRGIQV